MTESQLNQINNELAEQGQLIQVSDPNQDIYIKPIDLPFSAELDILILRNIQQWPTFHDNETHFLPMKKGDAHGFLVEGSFAINHGIAMNGGNGNATIYSSFEDILSDGWVVD